MAHINLGDFLRQIEELLDDEQWATAAAYSRHILHHFPRHLIGHRLLGKALAGQGEYHEAAEMFQRVLSADPEDMIAHAGVGMAYKALGSVPEAVWHFERAFELSPHNATIQAELKNVYRQRDGQEVARLQLTRGALARLYFQGGLYQQATVELGQLLAQESSRVDLQSLLVETLWRDGRPLDAVETAGDLARQLPNSVKANAVLTLAAEATGRHDEAYRHLQGLQALLQLDKECLDHNTLIGEAFGTVEAFVLPEKVVIEAPDMIFAPLLADAPLMPVEAGVNLSAWLAEELSDVVEDEVEPETLPEWLREFGAAGVVEEALAPAVISAEELIAADAVILDWWREVVGEGGVTPLEAAGEGEWQGRGRTEELADEMLSAAFLESRSEPRNEVTGANDWLRAALAGPSERIDEGLWPDLNSRRGEGAAWSNTPPPIDLSDHGYVDLPDWLDELSSDLADEANSEEQIMVSPDEHDKDQEPTPEAFEDPMAWLDKVAQETEFSPESRLDPDDAGTMPASAAEPPDWLTLDVKGTADDSGWPDWLEMPADNKTDQWADWAQAAMAGTPAAEETFMGEPTLDTGRLDREPLEDDLSWLDQIAAGRGPAIEELPTLRWPEEAEAGPADVEAPMVNEEFLRDEESVLWLEQVESTPAPAADELFDWGLAADIPEDPDEAMAWLEQLAAQQSAVGEMVLETGRGEGEEAAEGKAQPAVSDELPRDPEQLLAWLEQLAKLPDETAAGEATSVPEPTEEMPTMMGEAAAMTWLQEVVFVEEARLEEAEVAAGDLELPDWLKESAEDQKEPELTFEASLEAEVPDGQPPAEAEIEPEGIVWPLEAEVTAPIETSGEAAGLDAAREAFDAGDYETSLGLFEQLVTDGRDLPEVIVALEGVTAGDGHHLRARRVLGDAYVQNGQLKAALATYRSVLEELLREA